MMKKIFLCLILTGFLILSIGCSNKEVEVVLKTSMGDITLKLFGKVAPNTVENFVSLANGTRAWTDPNTGQKVKKPFYDGLIFHRVISDFMIQGGDPKGNGTGGPGYRFADEIYEKGTQIEGKIETEADALEVFMQLVVPYLQLAGRDADAQLQTIAKEAVDKQSGKPIMEFPVEFYQKLTNNQQRVYRKGKLKKEVEYGSVAMANSGPNTNGSQFFIVTKKGGTPWLNGKHTVFGKVAKGMDVVHKIEQVKTGANDKPIEDVVIQSVEVK